MKSIKSPIQFSFFFLFGERERGGGHRLGLRRRGGGDALEGGHERDRGGRGDGRGEDAVRVGGRGESQLAGEVGVALVFGLEIGRVIDMGENVLK
ncbi:hypothetical protein CDAR_578591 [Caerostris darwini]|uniref:Uncharacterized protein n=1 Tax=Caerostris darwini TaxID=1538125 RepID=A0AAV4UBY7_9ARAC|nr:hypothetical protein CDAR_578591 [Caerostris darwini]